MLSPDRQANIDKAVKALYDYIDSLPPEGDVVAYLDVGANGYLDLGSELSEGALQQLPKGRHALVIAGTYGVDGYVATPQPPPAAQADSVPAGEREQERIAFKDAHRHLDLDEVPDAWGRPMFKHSHVEASWLGWVARASHGQAPASVLHLVHSAFAEIAMAFPKAFALHKVGIADTAVREALAVPAPTTRV